MLNNEVSVLSEGAGIMLSDEQVASIETACEALKGVTNARFPPPVSRCLSRVRADARSADVGPNPKVESTATTRSGETMTPDTTETLDAETWRSGGWKEFAKAIGYATIGAEKPA